MKTQAVCIAAGLILISCFASAQWSETTGPRDVPVWCLITKGTNIFAGTAPYGPAEGGVFSSPDSGTHWVPRNLGLTSRTVRSLATYGHNLFAGTSGGVFLSTDDGAHWGQVSTGLTNTRVHSLALSPNTANPEAPTLFAGTYGGVFRSTNDGFIWTRTSRGLTTSDVMAFVVYSCTAGRATPKLFAGTYGGGVFVSSDNGDSWTSMNSGLSSLYVTSLAATDSSLFAGTEDGGVYRSTDGGTLWSPVNHGLENMRVQSLLIAEGTMLAATAGGVFVSVNEGDDWEMADSTLSTMSILSFGVHRSCVFVGTRAAGIWRCELMEMKTVDVSPDDAPFSVRTTLLQNYPNPFNPKTVVSCQWSVASRVRLVVYDLLGREVAVLMDEQKAPGRYQIEFDGAKLSSGVYIYRLIAGNFVESKRMLLLK